MNKIIIIFSTSLLFSASALFAGYYEQARSLYIHKNYDKAKEMFLKAAETSDLGNAYYFLGEIEKQKGNYRDAEKYYKTAITKKGISRQYLINAYWNALLMAEQREDWETMISICRAMWLKTGDASAKQKIEAMTNKLIWSNNDDAIAKYNEGIDLKKSGKTVEAVDKFKASLSIDPAFLAPKFEIGMIAYNNGDYDQAANDLSEIANKVSFYAEVHLILADIYFNKRNYSSAVDHFDKVLEFGFIDSSSEYKILMKRGTCYYNMRNYVNAEKDIEKALHYNSKSTDNLILLSAIKIKMDNLDDALKTLQRAQSIAPDNPEIIYQIGSIYYREKNPKYADLFERLFHLTSGKNKYPHKYQKVFVILAKHHFDKKSYGKMIEIVKTLDNKKYDYETRLMAAKAYYYLKDYDNAIDQFEKISLNNNDDKFILCKTYALSGRREKAKALLLDLALISDYLAQAKRDAALSSLAAELEKTDEAKKIDPDKKVVEEKKADPMKQDKKEKIAKPKPDDDSEEDEQEEDE